MDSYDIAIIGAGPAGLAAACEAQSQGLSHVLIDRRGLAHSFVDYPQTLRFFSPPDEMAVGDVPFPMRGGEKPSREDILAYFRAVATCRKLNLATWESITQVQPDGDAFIITTELEPDRERTVQRRTRAIVLATGIWDRPRCLDCSGAHLPHVFYRFHEPTEYLGHPVLVVGGGNSAVTAALALAEAHAKVTLVMRRPPVPYRSHLRPFVVRDLQFAVDEGKVDLHTNAIVTCIEPGTAWVRPAQYDPVKCRPCGEPYPVDARFVFALLGQMADATFLEMLGLSLGPDDRPRSDPATYETDRPGIYVAGSLVANEVDIVLKGREQAREVVRIIQQRLR